MLSFLVLPFMKCPVNNITVTRGETEVRGTGRRGRLGGLGAGCGSAGGGALFVARAVSRGRGGRSVGGVGAGGGFRAAVGLRRPIGVRR